MSWMRKLAATQRPLPSNPVELEFYAGEEVLFQGWFYKRHPTRENWTQRYLVFTDNLVCWFDSVANLGDGKTKHSFRKVKITELALAAGPSFMPGLAIVALDKRFVFSHNDPRHVDELFNFLVIWTGRRAPGDWPDPAEYDGQLPLTKIGYSAPGGIPPYPNPAFKSDPLFTPSQVASLPGSRLLIMCLVIMESEERPRRGVYRMLITNEQLLIVDEFGVEVEKTLPKDISELRTTTEGTDVHTAINATSLGIEARPLTICLVDDQVLSIYPHPGGSVHWGGALSAFMGVVARNDVMYNLSRYTDDDQIFFALDENLESTKTRRKGRIGNRYNIKTLVYAPVDHKNESLLEDTPASGGRQSTYFSSQSSGSEDQGHNYESDGEILGLNEDSDSRLPGSRRRAGWRGASEPVGGEIVIPDPRGGHSRHGSSIGRRSSISGHSSIHAVASDSEEGGGPPSSTEVDESSSSDDYMDILALLGAKGEEIHEEFERMDEELEREKERDRDRDQDRDYERKSELGLEARPPNSRGQGAADSSGGRSATTREALSSLKPFSVSTLPAKKTQQRKTPGGLSEDLPGVSGMSGASGMSTLSASSPVPGGSASRTAIRGKKKQKKHTHALMKRFELTLRAQYKRMCQIHEQYDNEQSDSSSSSPGGSAAEGRMPSRTGDSEDRQPARSASPMHQESDSSQAGVSVSDPEDYVIATDETLELQDKAVYYALKQINQNSLDPDEYIDPRKNTWELLCPEYKDSEESTRLVFVDQAAQVRRVILRDICLPLLVNTDGYVDIGTLMEPFDNAAEIVDKIEVVVPSSIDFTTLGIPFPPSSLLGEYALSARMELMRVLAGSLRMYKEMLGLARFILELEESETSAHGNLYLLDPEYRPPVSIYSAPGGADDISRQEVMALAEANSVQSFSSGLNHYGSMPQLVANSGVPQPLAMVYHSSASMAGRLIPRETRREREDRKRAYEDGRGDRGDRLRDPDSTSERHEARDAKDAPFLDLTSYFSYQYKAPDFAPTIIDLYRILEWYSVNVGVVLTTKMRKYLTAQSISAAYIADAVNDSDAQGVRDATLQMLTVDTLVPVEEAESLIERIVAIFEDENGNSTGVRPEEATERLMEGSRADFELSAYYGHNLHIFGANEKLRRAARLIMGVFISRLEARIVNQWADIFLAVEGRHDLERDYEHASRFLTASGCDYMSLLMPPHAWHLSGLANEILTAYASKCMMKSAAMDRALFGRVMVEIASRRAAASTPMEVAGSSGSSGPAGAAPPAATVGTTTQSSQQSAGNIPGAIVGSAAGSVTGAVAAAVAGGSSVIEFALPAALLGPDDIVSYPIQDSSRAGTYVYQYRPRERLLRLTKVFPLGAAEGQQSSAPIFRDSLHQSSGGVGRGTAPTVGLTAGAAIGSRKAPALTAGALQKAQLSAQAAARAASLGGAQNSGRDVRQGVSGPDELIKSDSVEDLRARDPNQGEAAPESQNASSVGGREEILASALGNAAQDSTVLSDVSERSWKSAASMLSSLSAIHSPPSPSIFPDAGIFRFRGWVVERVSGSRPDADSPHFWLHWLADTCYFLSLIDADGEAQLVCARSFRIHRKGGVWEFREELASGDVGRAGVDSAAEVEAVDGAVSGEDDAHARRGSVLHQDCSGVAASGLVPDAVNPVPKAAGGNTRALPAKNASNSAPCVVTISTDDDDAIEYVQATIALGETRQVVRNIPSSVPPIVIFFGLIYPVVASASIPLRRCPVTSELLRLLTYDAPLTARGLDARVMEDEEEGAGMEICGRPLARPRVSGKEELETARNLFF